MEDKYTKEEIQEHAKGILEKGMYCQLAFAVDNEPYGVTVNYGFDDNYLYFHSAQKGKKVEIMKKNPKVWYTIYSGQEIYTNEKACHWGSKFRSLMGTSKAELLTTEKDKTNGLKQIMKNYSGTTDHEFNPKIFDHTSVYRLKLENLTLKQNKMKWVD